MRHGSNTGPTYGSIEPGDMSDTVLDTITEVVTAARKQAPSGGTLANTCFVEFFDTSTVGEVVGGSNGAAPDITAGRPEVPPYIRPVGITVFATENPNISSSATVGFEGSFSIDRPLRDALSHADRAVP